LLPTPPYGDAVTFSYVRMHARTAGTFTLLFVCARGRTRSAALQRTGYSAKSDKLLEV